MSQPIKSIAGRTPRRCRRLGIRRSAFTIIELLVVISIIALLAALLMPALSAARESANTVTCSTRMRNIGFWSWQFAESYKYYPQIGRAHV